MTNDIDALARIIADAIGGSPDPVLARRIRALCLGHVATARPALDRVEPADEPAHHTLALRALARRG